MLFRWAPIGALPPGFVELLADIGSLEADYATDSAMALLNLATPYRSELMTQIEAAKRQSQSDNEQHSFSLVAKKDCLGVSSSPCRAEVRPTRSYVRR